MLKCTLLNSHVMVSKILCGVILMCSVINAYKVVQARKGSMLLALAMVMLLSFVLLYIDSWYSIGVMCFLLFPPSFILLLFFWEEFWHGMSHSFVLTLPAFSFPFKERENQSSGNIDSVNIYLQGLFVTIWHHEELSTFSRTGNWACFWVPCGKIFVSL